MSGFFRPRRPIQIRAETIDTENIETGACLVIEHDQIPPTDVEAAQVIDSPLGVVDVLVHHERGPSSILPVSQPNLSRGPNKAVRMSGVPFGN